MAYISEGVPIGEAHSYVGKLLPSLVHQIVRQRIVGPSLAQRIAQQAAAAYAHPDSPGVVMQVPIPQAEAVYTGPPGGPGGPVVMMPSVSVFPISVSPTASRIAAALAKIKKGARPVTVMTVPVPQARPQGVFPSRFPLRGRRVGWSRTGQTFRGLGDDSMFGQGGEYPVIHGGAPHSLFGAKVSEVF